ncbi:MAG: sterol desaturase family protein [Candidatus Andeanibacterium colombiense]|uniref:Sterol desaturase family protein n=1 Tax=Candidatus Andeanibacterium colombiense TaxID=3121345 RepID=A0AAJ5X8K9_9SPHN|nr:MAG: sterol desaturase family protein [Sphingomonadaceae bacterium]
MVEQAPNSSPLSSDVALAPDAYAAGEPAPGGFRATLVNLIPPATLVAVVAFWGLAPEQVVKGPWTLLIVAIVIMAWLQGLEFLFERHPGWRINWREFATDVFYVVLTYTAIGWLTSTLADGPLVALKQSLGLATPWLAHLPFLIQAAMVLFLVEFGQYWMHRGMHNWYPLWLTHAPHHHITQLNALKGAVGNPIELFLISLSVVALLDFSEAAVFCGIGMGSVISGFAHANVRSNPPLFYSFFFTTIRHHSLHHTALSYEDTRCNYGNSLIVIDRMFGTYREGESAIVGQDERKRLSIVEQWLFPFEPLIGGIRARRSRSASATG